MTKDYCLFCDKENKEQHRIICENDLFYSRWDNIPVSEGHAEVIPKKHIESFFELTDGELSQMYDLTKKTKDIISDKFQPDGYTLGINEGLAAGRTIPHLHFHIIPRYTGDVENPRGGVRNVIPGKGNYQDPNKK